MNKLMACATLLLSVCALSAHAGKPFPKVIATPDGAAPEGFTIGKGHTAYNASVDGSIYKFDLRTGKGSTIVAAEPDFDIFSQCHKLGLRVDDRTNYLFVAGCINGDAYVFDADSGDLIMKYQLDDSGWSVINDLVITEEAVYFTDFGGPYLYRLPLGSDGSIPADANAATAIPLSGDWTFTGYGGANGIVATPDGSSLIVGDSSAASLFNVDPNTGHATAISVEPALQGFIDGIARRGNDLYIMTPTYPTPVDMIQVVEMNDDMLSGTQIGVIMDSDLDDVASGAIFGNSLYVNNARYTVFPEASTEYWVTKLNIHAFE